MRKYIPKNAVLIPEHADRVFKGLIFDVYQWQQKRLDGSEALYEMIRRPDSVNIIAVEGSKIILTKETQPHVGSFIAFPAGMHDHGEEDELEAAKRELKEETGYTFKKWKLIATKVHSKKIEQIVYTFLATDLESIGEQNLDQGGEDIEVVKVSFAELKAMQSDKEMQFYPDHILGQVNSLEELLAMPSLFDYGN